MFTMMNVPFLLETVTQTEEKESFFSLVFATSSLWIMIPLFLMLGWVIYVFIERWITLSRATKVDRNFMNHIKDFIHEGRFDSAVALCKGNDSPLARMIEKGISRIGKPLGDISTAIENTGQLEVQRLEKRLSSIATISGIAPMVGFLGTVTGMISAFHSMASNPNNVNITDLSGGIYTAMITTVGGLIVGIIAYVFYNVLVDKVSSLIHQLEGHTTEFMDLLNEPGQ
ncbi:MAG: MotA/TolQ/ExbB proton channel family protein [Bacteroidales bacterium]|nr:MotA/TolQ/ExbB proton channel family protein [Bacteroidales bacterium]